MLQNVPRIEQYVSKMTMSVSECVTVNTTGDILNRLNNNFPFYPFSKSNNDYGVFTCHSRQRHAVPPVGAMESCPTISIVGDLCSIMLVRRVRGSMLRRRPTSSKCQLRVSSWRDGSDDSHVVDHPLRPRNSSFRAGRALAASVPD